MADTAKHFDSGKPPLANLPWRGLTETSKVVAFGANKYGMDNWRGGMAWMKLANSTLRHLVSWIMGENNDPESGLPHLAHASCDILFLLEYVLTKKGTDDRWVEPKVEELVAGVNEQNKHGEAWNEKETILRECPDCHENLHVASNDTLAVDWCECPDCNKAVDELLSNVKCHQCGTEMKRVCGPETVSYMHFIETVTVDKHECPKCGEAFFTGEALKIREDARERLRRKFYNDGPPPILNPKTPNESKYVDPKDPNGYQKLKQKCHKPDFF